MITLSSREYKNGAKCALRAENAIDTIQLKPISNRQAEPNIVCSSEITAIKLDNVEYVLPVANTVKSTYYRAVNNISGAGIAGSDIEFAKSRIECLMAHGTTICTSETPILGNPTVSFEFKGTSDIVSKDSSTYDNYPSINSMQSATYNLSSWITSAKDSTSENLLHDYSSDVVSMNPWIRNVVPRLADRQPTANDVYIDWFPPKDIFGERRPTMDGWYSKSNFNESNYNNFEMLSPNGSAYDLEYKLQSYIRMRNIYLPISYSVLKIDDFTVEVTWSLPVRIANAMASRHVGILGGEYDTSNYAYVDHIDKIILNVHAIPVNTTVQEVSYSLADGTLSAEQLQNEKILSIEAEELFTQDMYNGTIDEPATSPITYTPQKFIDADGEILNSSDHCITDYIFVPGGAKILIKASDTIPYDQLGYVYNVDKTPRASLRAAASTTSSYYVMIVSSVDCYIRINGEMWDYQLQQPIVYYRNPYLWTQKLSLELLKKYQNGKLVFECDVNAKWAIENDITVDTKMQIKLLNGELISRNENTCIFSVKNIEKKFNGQSFIYTLKLLEV